MNYNTIVYFRKFKMVQCMTIVDASLLTKIDVDAFSQMKSLTDLSITNTGISDVHFLYGTVKLKVFIFLIYLYIIYTHIYIHHTYIYIYIYT